ncbi:Protein GrpE [Candidatus Providencia siddallii]|uniref:Protein GrpE n=1 Tax=Candidatus Providencia siddallii TaxID=1715285 RepID=A0A0M6W9R3_9GAMM|nr:Protein GrpE [Candidatus Providencia siddallii]
MSSKDKNLHDEQNSDQIEIQDIELEKDKSNQCKIELASRIAELEQNLEESKKIERDILLRTQAEIENIRRRTEQYIEKAHKFALEKFLNELLPIIDNLERAIESTNKNDEKTKTIEGLNLTLKTFLDIISKFGIEVISKENIPFDPEIHQAISIIDSTEHKSGNVINIMQKGYTLNKRLLRPAIVTVSK